MKANTLTITVGFAVTMQVCPCAYASEIDAEAVLKKFADTLGCESNSVEIVIMCYGVAAYDDDSGIITIQYLLGDNSGSATTERRELPVVFVLAEDKKKLKKFQEDKQLDEISVVGYIDEEYKCFVCIKVDDPMGVKFVFP